MGLSCGIVGLPNVGKSTLFNALVRTISAQTANYPFCTIEPNTGIVAVPDPRLDVIASIGQSAKIVPASITFVDIAGLVQGASQGQGLGNQFLANIREVDVIVHVLRCFEHRDISHVMGRVDPISDAEVVETELMLADLESLEKRLPAMRKRTGATPKDKTLLDLAERTLQVLQTGKPARAVSLQEEERHLLRELMLLTSKPILYVCNTDESSVVTGNQHTKKVLDKFAANTSVIVLSADLEMQLAQLSQEEAQEFMSSLELQESGLDALIRAGQSTLGLISYFTVGPKETRAWTIKAGTRAPQAAGVIHSDFERGFIRANTVAYDDFVNLGGWNQAREAGKARDEGKEYIVNDGDVILFKTNT